MTPQEARQTFRQDSHRYAKARPHYPPELFQWIADQCSHCGRVWDCATGNGQAAQGLSPHFQEVWATDSSAEQLAQAVPCDNIRYIQASAEESGLPSATFDAITVAQALHWFDLEKFWAEVRRVAKPGALLCAWGYGWFETLPEVDHSLVQPFRRLIAPFWAPNNRLLLEGYRPQDLDFPFPLLPVPSFSIRLEWRLEQLLRYLQTWSAYKRSLQEPEVAAALASLLQQVSQPDMRVPVTMDIKLIAGRVDWAGG